MTADELAASSSFSYKMQWSYAYNSSICFL